MADIWSTYPYLWWSLSSLTLALLILLRDPHQRRYCLVSGLLSAPYGFASLVYVPEYWNPIRIITFWKTGPEDLIFSFANGVVAWKIAALLTSGRLVSSIDLRHILFGYGVISGLGFGLTAACWSLGVGIMASTMIACGPITLVLLVVRRNLWLLSLAGGVGFSLYYFPTLLLIFRIWPSFLDQWNSRNLWGASLVGIPADEMVWAFVYGLVWPLWMGWLFRSRINNQSFP